MPTENTKLNDMNGVDDFIFKSRLKSMLKLQDGINSKILPDWRDANNVWLVDFADCLDKNPTNYTSVLYGQFSKKDVEVAHGR